MSSQKNIFEIGLFLSEHGPFFEKCILARSVRRVPNRPKIEKIDFHQTHPKWPKFHEKVENRKISARKVHFGPISADLDPEKKVPKNAFFWKSENPVFATPTARKPKIRFSRFWAHFVEFSEHFKMNLMTPQSDPPFSHTGPKKTAKIAKSFFDGAGIVEKSTSPFWAENRLLGAKNRLFWPKIGQKSGKNWNFFSKFSKNFWTPNPIFTPKREKRKEKCVALTVEAVRRFLPKKVGFLKENRVLKAFLKS